MSQIKDAILDKEDAERADDERAEYAARGLRDKKQPNEYDAFDYLYDNGLLPPLSEPHSRADLERLAQEHLRDSRRGFEPIGEDATFFQADQ